MTALWFDAALLPDGWAEGVRIVLSGTVIAAVEIGAAPRAGDACYGSAIPGLPNLHSHSFQRLLAGLAETPPQAGSDDFWGWRSLMYRLVDRLTPDDVAAVAAMAFAEMLEAGFTRVGEFHYLHHQPSGDPYADPAEMAVAIAAAAAQTGIALTLLPVFYAHAGFGGLAPNEGQRRFINDIDGYAKLLDASQRAVAGLPGAVVGIAPHSLRAVTPEELGRLVAVAGAAPIHIHVAEQQKEVADCVAWSGQRPVAWLLDHAPVDPRWCLVHATHVDAGELSGIVDRGAVVGLCPITEANLGDGLFPAAEFAGRGGRFGIGSDSNVLIDAGEELRLLEYGQRLFLQRRNVLSRDGRSTGRSLFDAALAGGSQALGSERSAIAVGADADIVALTKPSQLHEDQALDRWIFTRGRHIDSVWRAGRQVVNAGRHVGRAEIETRFETVVARLLA